MSNTFLPSNLIAPEAVAIFKALNSFIHLGNRRYENMYKNSTYKSGDTINVRLDNFFAGARGNTVSAEDLVEASQSVTIGPVYSVAMQYQPTDLQRDIVSFSKEVIAPAVRRISAMINNDITAAANTQLYHYVGSTGAPINSYAALTAVTPVMDILNMNNYPRTEVLDPLTAQNVRQNSTLQNSFLPALNRDITIEGQMGRIGGMEIMQDTSINAFVSGTQTAAGNVTISPAVTTGNVIVLNGFTSGATVVPGDLFSVQGVYTWDTIKQQATSQLAQFVVTVGGTAGGGGTISVTVSPAVIPTGPRKNISTSSLPNNAVVSFVNQSTTGYLKNIAFTDRALVLCMPPMQPMHSPYSATASDEGVSMRVSQTADVLNNINILRIDAQAAISWIADQAVVNIGQVPAP